MKYCIIINTYVIIHSQTSGFNELITIYKIGYLMVKDECKLVV